MKTPGRFSSKKVMEIMTGLILFSLSAIYWMVPLGIRDESGESYILLVCLLTIGCVMLIKGLQDKSQS